MSPLWSAWDKGWNFRETSGFVTDGTNETYAIQETYPITRNSVTFGWTANLPGNARDRTNGSPETPRLSGLNASRYFGTPQLFRVDLPATGDYAITLAFGDPGGGFNTLASHVYDDSTTLITLGPTSNSSGQFFDAAGTNHTSAANWISSNAAVTKTFATTIFNVSLSETDDLGAINHLFLSQQGGGGAVEVFPRRQIIVTE